MDSIFTQENGVLVETKTETTKVIYDVSALLRQKAGLEADLVKINALLDQGQKVGVFPNPDVNVQAPEEVRFQVQSIS